MTAPFRPSVVPLPGPQNIDTFSRAFQSGLGFVEDIRESQRARAEFDREQRMAGLRQRALEQELDIRGRAEIERILRDPTLRTSAQRAEQDTTGRTVGTPRKLEQAFEQASTADVPTPQITPPAPGEIEAPTTAAEFAEVAPTIDMPEEVFAPGGEALEIPRFDVTAPAPRQLGEPEVKPPSVADLTADELGPRRQRDPLESIGRVPGLGQVFFDPRGGEREAFAGASFAAQNTRDILERAARAAAQSGQQALADRITDRIETGVARIEAGNAPGDVVNTILDEARTAERVGGEEQFLTEQIEELGGAVPEGLEALTPEGRISELQGQRTRLQQQSDALALAAARADQAGDVTERDRFNAQLTQQIIGTFNQQTRALSDAAQGFGAMQAAFDQLQQGEPAAAIAMMFAYGKVLDPGSVVREGEISTLQRIGSVDARVRRAFRLALSGTLPEDLAQSIMNAGQAIMEQRATTFTEIRDAAINRAAAADLNLEELQRSIPDVFKRFIDPADPGDQAAGRAEAVRQLLGEDGFPEVTGEAVEFGPTSGAR